MLVRLSKVRNASRVVLVREKDMEMARLDHTDSRMSRILSFHASDSRTAILGPTAPFDNGLLKFL
jgi:hypothetical protein